MTPERRAEAEKAGSSFHLALAYIGIASIEEAYSMWASLPPEAAPAAIERWLRQMGLSTQAKRRESRELAIAYYRLIRALHTGRSIVDPWGDANERTVTLGKLRSDFSTLVEDALDAQAKSEKAKRAIPDDAPDEPEHVESDEDSDEEVVEVDDIDVRSVRIVAERDDDDADEAQRRALVLNLDHYRAKRERARNEKELKQAEVDAANVSAASVQKGSVDGARGQLHVVGRRDGEAIGYVRLSRTGTPCGFCAMLISRGLTLYSSRSAAERRSSDGEQYHPNCWCYAEPVFSASQFENDPRFALNKEYAKLWPKVTEGYSGRDALNAWRRYINRRNKAGGQSADTQAV